MTCVACDTLCTCSGSKACLARDAASIVFDLQLAADSAGKVLRGTVDAPTGKFTITLTRIE
ncbi:MAG: hypothetical protein QM756_05235 [Polyangiaceae bacterium]